MLNRRDFGRHLGVLLLAHRVFANRDQFVFQEGKTGKQLFAGGELIGSVVPFVHDSLLATDDIRCVDDGIFEWKRTFSFPRPVPLNLDLTMDFATAWKASYSAIPAVSYNGNHWGRGNEPKGFVKLGQPWSFAFHRVAVAGATYSEGRRWSLCLFGKAGPNTIPFACSLVPGSDNTTHRLIWPEQEGPLLYSGTDRYDPPFRGQLPANLGDSFSATAYLVVNANDEEQRSWHKFLDAAWRMNFRPLRPRLGPQEIWDLGIQYAKESLWTDDGEFRGFAIGLEYGKGNWHQARRYEIGWCGQNVSLANSLLVDYIKTKARDSLGKGIACLDTWATKARLDNGLVVCHFDLIREKKEDVQDAVNLGSAALNFFEAFDLTQKVGVERPIYTQAALGICDYACKAQLETGRFSRAWHNDGSSVDAEGSSGCFLVTPLVVAYKTTGQKRYLHSAVKGYWHYNASFDQDGYTAAGALDTFCIDKESAIPLLTGGIALYECTGDRAFLEAAEQASYYLSTWQWHHTVSYPKGSALEQLNYDSFGGTSVSTQHHHQDPFALCFVNVWLRLAELTGHEIWRQRALAAWANGTIGISDGTLEVLGKRRPAGSQDEGFFHTRWGRPWEVSEWLVAWPGAFRLETLRHRSDWSLFEP